MNRVLAELERSGLTELPTGELVRLHGHVGPASGRVLRAGIELSRPSLAVEVGLAFGVSTLHILDAMASHGGGRLIGMDPAQHDSTWRGGGLHNVRRAGFQDAFEFYETASQEVLPRLAASGLRIQFGFIDGWHTFDHALVDFFFIDRMLDVGGVVVLDDVGYPGLRRLCHFLVTNRDYVMVDHDPRPPVSTWRSALKRRTRRLLHGLVRDDTTPSPASSALEAAVDSARLVALRKRGEDSRTFDHFVAF